MTASPDRSSIRCGRVPDDELGIAPALPFVGAQMSGDVERCSHRSQQRLPQRVAGAAKGDRFETSPVRPGENAAHVVGADDIRLDDARTGNREPGLRISGAVGPGAFQQIDQVGRRGGDAQSAVEAERRYFLAVPSLRSDMLGQKFGERRELFAFDREARRHGVPPRR